MKEQSVKIQGIKGSTININNENGNVAVTASDIDEKSQITINGVDITEQVSTPSLFTRFLNLLKRLI